MPVPTNWSDWDARDKVNSLVKEHMSSNNIPIPIPKVSEIKVQIRFGKKGPRDVDDAGKPIIDALCPQISGIRGSQQKSRVVILAGDTYDHVPRMIFEVYGGDDIQPLEAWLHISY